MIFWTGDNSSHNVWDNTNEEVTNYTIHVTEMIKSKFDSNEVTIIPIQGNHDTWPVDIQDFSASAKGTNYPINHFKSYWSDWLEPEALEKFGEYGFYSMPFKIKNGKTVPNGSRIIAYNTQFCDSHNWYLLENRIDEGN